MPPPVRRAVRATAVAVGALLSAASCDGDGTRPVPTVARLVIEPAAPAPILAGGQTLALTARALGAGDVELAGRAISWSSEDPAVATVGPTGTVTSGARGLTSIRAAVAAAPGRPDSVTASVPLTVLSRAASMAVAAAPATGVVAGQSAGAIGVRVLDAAGAPVPGEPVDFVVTAGGGAVSVAAATTDAAGVASVALTTGPIVGPNTVRATVRGTTVAVDVSTTTVAGPADAGRSTIAVGQTTVTANGTSAAAVTIELRDANGNLTAAGGPPTATRTGVGTLSALAAGGPGAWVALLTSTAAGTATVAATVGGQPVQHSPRTVTFVPGPASLAASTVAASPGTVTANGASAATVTVRLRDAFGNALTSSGGVVTLSRSGVGALSAVADAGDGSYAATLSSTAAGAATVTASLDGQPLTHASNPATVTFAAGPAARLALAAGDAQRAVAGAAVPVAPSVLATDANGNPVAGIPVTFTVTAGGGTVQSGATSGPSVVVATNAAGVAALDAWTLGTALGANVLTAAAAGLAGSPVSFAATATVGPVAALQQVTPSPVGIVAGQTAGPLQVRAVDAVGNPTPGVAVVFTASGGGTVSPASAVTDTAGLAATTLMTAPAAGANQVSVRAPAAPSAWALLVVVTVAGPAATLAPVAGDGQAAPSAVAVPVAPRVVVRDANGNPVAGVPVTFTVTAGGGTVQGGAASGASVTAVTNPGGEAAATAWVLGGPAGTTNTLAATAPGLAGSPVTFTATVMAPWTAITAGGQTCGLKGAGDAYCWGANSSGELGDGTTTSRSTPTAVVGGLAFTALAAGYDYTCGLTSGGAAHCWGGNSSGQLGDGSTTNRLTPTAVAGGLAFAAIAAGWNHTCAITTGGAAYCWGQNGAGQLGDGTTTSRSTPTAVVGGHVFASITVGGSFTCAVTTAGSAYCWGSNFRGQLGNGTTFQRSAPWLVSLGTAFRGISAGGNHACGVTTSGDGYCWGDNTYGMIGDGTSSPLSQSIFRPWPERIGSDYAAIAAGGIHTCGLKTSGAAFCWGGGLVGQRGDGTTTRVISSPEQVAGGLVFTSLDAGGGHNCALTAAGAAYCWGFNGGGAVGDGTTTNRLVPTAVARGAAP